MSKMCKFPVFLCIFVVQGLPARGQNSMFFGSCFRDCFWKPFGRVLDGNMEAQMAKKRDTNGTRNDVKFWDDFLASGAF